MPTPDQQPQRSLSEPRIFTVTSRRIPPRFPRYAEIRVPYLRLSGRWLERCGFATDALVNVTAEQGRLTITLRGKAPAPAQSARSHATAAPPQRPAPPRPRLSPMRRRLRRCAISRASGVRRVVAARTAALRAALRAEVDRR